jgi:hypothetical protein
MVWAPRRPIVDSSKTSTAQRGKKRKAKNMLKKLLVTVITAGAMSVPLAGLAGADTSSVPGKGAPSNQIGIPPGQGIEDATKPPGAFYGVPPGKRVSQFLSPGHQK